ncbi:MAG: efflux RND transporter periplasmic adaptor subunit, partial [Nitrospiraceae bacterium]
PNPLALYEPQLKNARAGLASAAARVEQARLDLERTTIKAPFDARVRSEDIEQGQYVRSGTVVAVLAGTETADISIPLSLDDLSWLAVPGPGQRRNGALAEVHIAIGGKSFQWEGRVVRSTGEVDPRSRMMQLIVEVKDPYGLNRKGPASPSLAAGSFVDVRIRGKTLEDVFTLPRRALRDNSTIWIMDGDSELHIRTVKPLRIERDYVIIGEGLEDGDLVVMTRISGAADGMKLRRME